MATGKGKDRFASPLALIVLCFAGLVLNEVKADIKGIPHNQSFANAEYPYARVLSGCTDWRRPEQIESDNWGHVSFKAACQQHDKCYHTIGITWSECNQGFLEDLKNACDRDLKQNELASRRVAEPDPSELYLCYQIAELFLAKVQRSDVRRRFQTAQMQQESYLSYVRSEIQRLFAKVAKRVASDLEIAEAVEALDSGLSFSDIERNLRAGREVVPAEARAMNPDLESEPSGFLTPTSITID